jgi:hypothetical protein
METQIAMFMIEGGKPLEMIKQHIAERNRVWGAVRALAKELEADQVYTDRTNGILSGVVFRDDIHPDFAKPKKRGEASYPKKGTAWAKRLKEQQGYRDPAEWISKEFGIPLVVEYDANDGGWGSTCIGSPLTECGFLYLGEEGPFAMWAPDVPAIVEKYRSYGTVREPAASFRFNIPGCLRIEEEEWRILVLQHELEQKRAKHRPAEASGLSAVGA